MAISKQPNKMETQKTNLILKIISFLVIFEGIYALYKTIFSLLYFYSSGAMIIYSIASILDVLLLLTGIGIFFKKRWAIVLCWIAILLPIVIPYARVFPTSGYSIIILNVILATYLTLIQRKEWNVNNTNKNN